jgi:transglutaminase-like putative cysteine protease
VFIEFDGTNGRINIDTTRRYAEDRTTNVTDPYPPTATINWSGLSIFVNGKWELLPQYEILGRTYTPIRSIAPHIGLDVDYNQSTNTVILYKNNKPTITPSPTPTDNFLAPADNAVAPFIAQLKASNMTEREIIVALADYLCDRIEYDHAYAEAVRQNIPYVSKGTINDIFAGTGAKGVCGSYANAFRYLCNKMGIPVVIVSDHDHAWNEVFVGGEWLIVDTTNYDTARSSTWILTTYDKYPKQDENPAQTALNKANALK